MRYHSFIAVLFLSLFSSNSNASDLIDKLKRMSEVDEEQSYQGVFILRKSDMLSTLRVTHGVDEKGVWESLEALNGEPRKVVRHNNSIVSVFPARELVTIRQSENNQSLHRQLPDNIDQLEQFYSVHQLADDRIANHSALVVDLVPTDNYRYGYRYWLDKNTGMLLRCDLIADGEKVIEQMMFTSLDYSPQAPANRINLQQFERFKQQVIMDSNSTLTATKDYGWKINQLPKGFMLIQSNMRYSTPLTINNVSMESSSDLSSDSFKLDLSEVEVAKSEVSGAEIGGTVISEAVISEAKEVSTAQVNPLQINPTPANPIHHSETASAQQHGDPQQAAQTTVAVKPDLLHLVYSDGLASVSVFIKKSLEGENHFEGVATMGAINAFGNYVDDYFVTVVGVVPVNTVQVMAQSTVKSLMGLSE